MNRVLDLDPVTYRRHLTHVCDRSWAETNCYTDVLLEMLHGMGHEPLAALPFTLAIDFDVDQWTFFKFPPVDLEDLYGVALHELAPWRPLVEHVDAFVAAGRLVLVELDSCYLPDTHGTAYRVAHVKSTVAVNAIDVAGRRMEYFHNQGYHALEGADFTDIFQVDGLVHPRMLPPYIEFVKPVPGVVPPRGAALVDASLRVLRKHLGRLPRENPFRRYAPVFERDAAALAARGDIEQFHTYSFVTLRQLGASFELAGAYLRWLSGEGVDVGEGAPAALGAISQSAKAMQFQLARAIARRRPLGGEALEDMARRWDEAVEELSRRFL
jgi:hypothetical protein